MHFAKADLGVNTSTWGGAAASAGMHGLVGGMISMAAGRNFKSGFLAAGFSDLTGDDGSPSQVNARDLAEHAIAGGIGSVLGGDKFENGAVTGAFGYLYNEALTASDYTNPMCTQAGVCEHIAPNDREMGKEIVRRLRYSDRRYFWRGRSCSCLGLSISGESWVTVGRWMSKEEFAEMRETGRMVESRNGISGVSLPADSETYLAAPKAMSLPNLKCRSHQLAEWV